MKHSDWIFSAAIKYGRATSDQHAHQQMKPEPFVRYYYTSYPTAGSGHISRRPQKNVATPHAAKFADTDARTSEQHFVLDFQEAGKDVGLGMFGSKDGSSVVNLGIRFAQFSSKSNIGLKSNPDWHFNYKYLPTSVLTPNNPSPKLAYGEIYHSNSASLRASRNFHGIGPSLSWNASAPLIGDQQAGELALDWTANAALLFGRQRTKVHHQSTGRYHGAKYNVGARPITAPPVPFDQARSRSVVVPNIGRIAGTFLSYGEF